MTNQTSDGSSKRSSNRSSSSTLPAIDDIVNQFNQLKVNVAALEGEKQDKEDELRHLRSAKRSYEETILTLSRQLSTIEAEKRSLQAELKFMNSAEDKVYRQDLELQKLQGQASQEEAIKAIGREVRLRFLENHRRCHLNRRRDAQSNERMKAGNRAAHRGRPVPDAYLCVTGAVEPDVYEDLYGVSPEDMAPRDAKGKHKGKGWCEVPDMADLVGFRGSLCSEGKLSSDFKDEFKALLRAAHLYDTPAALKNGFQRGDRELTHPQERMTRIFDDVVSKQEFGKKVNTGKVGW